MEGCGGEAGENESEADVCFGNAVLYSFGAVDAGGRQDDFAGDADHRNVVCVYQSVGKCVGSDDKYFGASGEFQKVLRKFGTGMGEYGRRRRAGA